MWVRRRRPPRDCPTGSAPSGLTIFGRGQDESPAKFLYQVSSELLRQSPVPSNLEIGSISLDRAVDPPSVCAPLDSRNS